MGFLRTDGKYKIYIIKHLYNDDPTNEWGESGDCRQFIPKSIRHDYNLDKTALIKIFNNFTACGDCWQKTGISGSFVKIDAINILDKISKWRPEHRFKVCVLFIDQITEDVVEKKYAQIA